MAKKPKRSESLQAQQPVSIRFFRGRGGRLVAGGGGLLLVGFFLLTRTDPYGADWASWFSPVAVLSGYGLIALGLFSPPPDPPETS